MGWKAIDDFRGLLEDLEPLKRAVSQSFSNKAHVQLLFKRPELALEDCRKALEVDFENAKAYWRGTQAALQLRSPEAAELLRQGLRMAYEGPALPKLSLGGPSRADFRLESEFKDV